MLAIYRSLLRLYPAAYYREYGPEMVLVFAQAHSDTQARSLKTRASFYFREGTGLVAGALRQRLFGPSWNLPRRFNMRPEFRFPRSTVFLMCVILAGVVWAIEKAKVIQMKYGPAETMAVWDSLPWWLLYVFAFALVSVAVVWAILFALRRTGMHRLGNVQTWPEQQ
jgi:hypothetical protein